MVRTTRHLRTAARSNGAGAVILFGVLAAALLFSAGCSKAADSDIPAAEDKKGYGMGGVEQEIAILAETVNNKPAPWNLETPESAVRSYLDWVSYAYRVAESDVATPTQSPFQVVRTDAYVQANLQQERLLDQVLTSITFGSASIEGTKTVLPATEQWSYRYVSIKDAGKTIGGPYTANYETIYTLVNGDNGWVVDGIDVKTLGEVK
jgi:alpha-L-arabinofuranosidase